MAKKEKSLKSAKRYGARYGRTIKLKVAVIEEELRKKHKCPYCHYNKVHRLAVGIWQCRKCNVKFTGKAYSVMRKIMFHEKAEEPTMEEIMPEEKPDELEAEAKIQGV